MKRKNKIGVAVILGVTIGLTLKFNPELKNFEEYVTNIKPDSLCKIREWGLKTNYFVCSSYYYYMDCENSEIEFKDGRIKEFLNNQSMKVIIADRKKIEYLGLFNSFFKIP